MNLTNTTAISDLSCSLYNQISLPYIGGFILLLITLIIILVSSGAFKGRESKANAFGILITLIIFVFGAVLYYFLGQPTEIMCRFW